MTILDVYKKLLSEFVAFRSISTDPIYEPEMHKTVAWLKTVFEKNGFTVTIAEGFGNPIIIAKYTTNPAAQTCLVYGHYDVQPAVIEDGWRSDPFTLAEHEGRLVARGSIDNKGQVLVHMVTIFNLIHTNQLQYNITFMIEGNEETGSPRMPQFIAQHKDILRADFALLSDGEMAFPTLEVGFRGGFNAELTCTTSHTDLHSGLYGHAAPNAAQELIQFLARLYDAQNHITVPGFYNDVDPIPDAIRKQNESLPFRKEEYERVSGTRALICETGYDFYSQTGLRPAIEVTGITSGYTGVGFRNAIPPTAKAKINFRLVKNQNPEQIIALFREYLKTAVPAYVSVEFTPNDPYEGIKLDPADPYITAAAHSIEQAFGKKPVYKYCGGGLPIVTLNHDILGLTTVSVSLASEDCAMHAVHENFKMENLEQGLRFSELFFSKK